MLESTDPGVVPHRHRISDDLLDLAVGADLDTLAKDLLRSAVALEHHPVSDERAPRFRALAELEQGGPEPLLGPDRAADLGATGDAGHLGGDRAADLDVVSGERSRDVHGPADLELAGERHRSV